MNYEIEFKMIEIKDLSKIQKRKMAKESLKQHIWIKCSQHWNF